MICSDIPAPLYFLFSDSVPRLLYYSHIPTAAVVLLLGFYVFFKSSNLVSKILLSISIVFSLWLFLNLISWTNINSGVVMFVWSFFGILTSLVFILSYYFVYVFINNKDLGLLSKFILGIVLLPVILLAPYYLHEFDVAKCEAVDNIYYVYYYNIVCAVIFVSILILSLLKYRKADKSFKKQVLFLTIGIEIFLLSFFVTGFFASYLDNQGLSYAFELEQYGLFGMTFFMGVLAYIIVKFKAFNIKLIGAQALVSILILLVASQYTFAQNAGSIILTGITLALSIGFGYILIKSIKTEVQRKDELQFMADALAQSNDKLRQLDNAKTEFVSIASHQLRTPLTAIKGFVSLLMEGSYGEMSKEAQDALGKVHLSTERLIHLVEELLNVSRIESGRMEYKFENQDICILLEEMVESFEIIAKENNLSFEVKLPDKGLPQVSIDSAKMREVISNLVDNAFKYTKKGGVIVKAEFDNESRYKAPMGDENNVFKFQHKNHQENIGTNGYVRVTISDTGIGIPASEIPYLFAKFSRGKDTQRLHVSGTGLGLYVGKGIVEAHKGHIWIESDGEGRGSRFIVELPAVGL